MEKILRVVQVILEDGSSVSLGDKDTVGEISEIDADNPEASHFVISQEGKTDESDYRYGKQFSIGGIKFRFGQSRPEEKTEKGSEVQETETDLPGPGHSRKARKVP